MICPEYLKPGDKIGIVSPARFVDITDIQTGIERIRNHGFQPVLGKYIYAQYHQFGGTEEQRIEDFQTFINDPDIKAIFCTRGGYGSVRIINEINWTNFIKKPKWIIGFSDITVFHSLLNIRGIESLHAPMIFNLQQENFEISCFDKIFDILKGEKLSYSFPRHKLNKDGKSRGILVGGNLSVLYSLRGTSLDVPTHDKILFIEDVDEYLYHIDRMLMNFKLGDKLNNLRGIIVGQMTDMKDNKIPFGKDAYEIIAEHTAELNIPIVYGFPAGHEKINLPFILGREILLEAEQTVKICFK